MSKPIKLRFWCNEHGYIKAGIGGAIREVLFNQRGELGFPCPSCSTQRPMLSEESILVMDKNGKEIYAGDILNFDNPEGETFFDGTAYVKFNGSIPGYSVIEHHADEITQQYYDSSMFWHDADDIEIIGNIHENPEAIKHLSEVEK